jgi:hypothetical protein
VAWQTSIERREIPVKVTRRHRGQGLRAIRASISFKWASRPFGALEARCFQLQPTCARRTLLDHIPVFRFEELGVDRFPKLRRPSVLLSWNQLTRGEVSPSQQTSTPPLPFNVSVPRSPSRRSSPLPPNRVSSPASSITLSPAGPPEIWFAQARDSIQAYVPDMIRASASMIDAAEQRSIPIIRAGKEQFDQATDDLSGGG